MSEGTIDTQVFLDEEHLHNGVIELLRNVRMHVWCEWFGLRPHNHFGMLTGVMFTPESTVYVIIKLISEEMEMFFFG